LSELTCHCDDWPSALTASKRASWPGVTIVSEGCEVKRGDRSLATTVSVAGLLGYSVPLKVATVRYSLPL
jgi:hypothetical protein